MFQKCSVAVCLMSFSGMYGLFQLNLPGMYQLISWVCLDSKGLSPEFDRNLLACLLNLSEMYRLFRLNLPESTGFSAEFIKNVPTFLLNLPGSTSFSAEFIRYVPTFLLNLPGSTHRLFCWLCRKCTGLSAELVWNVPASLLWLPWMCRLISWVCLECTGFSAMFSRNVPAY